MSSFHSVSADDSCSHTPEIALPLIFSRDASAEPSTVTSLSGAAFPAPEARVNASASGKSTNRASRVDLRILITTPPGSLLNSPPTAPQTTVWPPQVPSSRHAVPAQPTFAAVPSALDPNLATAIHQFNAQRSAVALLNADMSVRTLRGTAGRGGPSRRASIADLAAVAALTVDVPPSPSTAGGDGKPSALEKLRMTALAQVFLTRGRLKTAAPSPTCAAKLANSDSHELVAEGEALEDVAAPVVAASRRSTDNATPKPPDPVSPAISAVGGDGPDDIGMDRVLEEASKVTGMRFSWLLYLLISMIIVLFVLVFVVICNATNTSVKLSGTQTLQSHAVSTTNNAELLNYDLFEFLRVVNATYPYFINSDLPSDSSGAAEEDRISTDVLCSRLHGAPVAIVLYVGTGEQGWSVVCEPSELEAAGVLDTLPADVVPAVLAPRLVTHTDTTVAAYLTLNNVHGATVGTIVVFLDKSIIGRVLFSNYQPGYSPATLQKLYLGVLLQTWTSLAPSIAFTSLTMNHGTYIRQQYAKLGVALQRAFDDICNSGDSRYEWHSVVHTDCSTNSSSDNLNYVSGAEAGQVVAVNGQEAAITEGYLYPSRPSRNTTTHEFPTPYMEAHGAWKITSRMTLCGVLCRDNSGLTCSRDNPIALWFVIDSSLTSINQQQTLDLIGGISIVAVVVFSLVLLIVWMGISVPVHFLHYQLRRAVGSDKGLSGCQVLMYRATRRFWLTDLVSLVRAVHVLCSGFSLNKKYVPVHVLRNHAKQLHGMRIRLSIDAMARAAASGEDEEEDEDTGSAHNSHTNTAGNHDDDDINSNNAGTGSGGLGRRGGGNGAQLEDFTEFVTSTTTLHRNASLRLGRTARGPAAEDRGDADSHFQASLRRALPLLDPSVSATAASAGDEAFGRSMMAGSFLLSPEVCVDFNDPFIRTVHMRSPSVIAASAARVGRPSMEVRRDGEATILCVRVGDVDSAYLLDSRMALKQHRRIIRFLLSRIRHFKGAVFYHSGECLAAAWNAFESCYNHAECAAACAQEVSNAFAPYREQGLNVGIVLHQGTFVFGTVEDTREAFITAFGEGPRQALALAELASAQPAFSVIVTEPVKQALSSQYEFLIADVIDLPDRVHSLILFELGPPRQRSPLAASAGAEVHSPRTPTASSVVVEYAKVFALFRSHDFKAVLDGIQTIRQEYVCIPRVDRLLHRLEVLSFYYRTNSAALPTPYARLFPFWENYELVASYAEVREGSAAGEVAGANGSGSSPTSTVAHYGRASDSGDTDAKGAAAAATAGGNAAITATASTVTPSTPAAAAGAVPTTGLAGSPILATAQAAGGNFSLSEVLYRKVPPVYDAELNFKRDLHDNVKRLGTPLQKSPNLPPQRPLVGCPMRPLPPPLPSSPGEGHLSPRQATAPASAPPPSPALSGSGSGRPPAPAAAAATSSAVALSVSGGPGFSTLRLLAVNQASTTASSSAIGGSASTLAPAARRSSAVAGPPPLVGFTVPALSAASAVADAHSSPLLPSPPPSYSPESNSISLSQRCFSMVHPCDSQPPLALDPSVGPGLLVSVGGSEANLAGETAPHAQSLIQSIGVSIVDADGHFSSAGFSAAELPSEIVGKNGTTYLRSARVLGRGSFGSVYLGMNIHSGRLVAIKFLPMPSDDSGLAAVEAEVIIMQCVKDTHVVEFVTYAFEGSHIVLVMECMMAGSLQNMISAFTVIPSATVHLFMRDVLRGLNKLHSMGVVHRDVKPHNVLLSLAGNCKISDFGASAWLHQLARKEAQGLVLGTPVYLAPEAARGMPVETSDIWSCGIMFLQLITGRLPYPDEQLRIQAPLLVYQIGSGTAVPVIPDTLDELDRAFALACLRTNPADRKSANQLLQMALFTL